MKPVLAIASALLLLVVLSGPARSEPAEANDSIWTVGLFNNLMLTVDSYVTAEHVSTDSAAVPLVFGWRSDGLLVDLIDCQSPPSGAVPLGLVPWAEGDPYL